MHTLREKKWETILKSILFDIYLMFFLNKNVHQDTLDPTVQHNVLILRTDSHARDFVTVAMTHAICLGVV